MSKKRLSILLVALGVAAGTFACSEALNPQPLPPSTPEGQGGSVGDNGSDKSGEPTSGTSSSSGGSSSGSATPGDAGGADAGDATFAGDGGADGSNDDASTGKD